MTLTWINHIRQLIKAIIPELISMIATLRAILRATSNENLPIIRLNRTKPYRYRKVLQQHLSRLPIIIDIVVCDVLLVKFEEVDAVILERVCCTHY